VQVQPAAVRRAARRALWVCRMLRRCQLLPSLAAIHRDLQHRGGRRQISYIVHGSALNVAMPGQACM
jgi:hypothetical protein